MTIVLLPGGNRTVRQICIPRYLFGVVILICLSVAALLVWGTNDYRRVKKQVPLLTHLKKENAQQKTQLVILTQKVDQISKKLVELKNFDHKLKTMVNLETDEDDSQFLGIGGSDPSAVNPDYTIEKAHRKLVRLLHQSLDNLNTEISIQINEKAELHKFFKQQKSMLAHTPSIWPAKGWISSRFGYRISPFTNEREFHKGLDISTRKKSPVIAPSDGIVSSVSRDHGYGILLTVSHGHGLKTRYAHLDEVLVKQGQYIKRGQKIALVGDTGRTTGPHLHYEVHLNEVAVNPLRYILN